MIVLRNIIEGMVFDYLGYAIFRIYDLWMWNGAIIIVVKWAVLMVELFFD